ncbi:hypothetical protein [Algihabitans sp.]|uniref:hypothetical protein n=1 Tax=Algihabitans sp. TaxID=2821514 RepID=UPI003BAAD7B2
MELAVVNDIFGKSVEQYDSALLSIKHCLIAYERICAELIEEISSADSLEDARQSFNFLEDIQDKISTLSFNRKINIGKKLDVFVREFDSVYDDRMKEYWYKEFKSGVKWPSA